LDDINRLVFGIEIGSEVYKVFVGEEVIGAENNPA
jgi:hypothetical protein